MTTEDPTFRARIWLVPAVKASLLPDEEMKLAVIVPSPSIVAVVEDATGLLISIRPLYVQDENV